MELQLYFFEVLAVVVIFLSAAIARSMLLVLWQTGRSEIDYYLSLEALSDCAKELVGIDEVSRTSPTKVKRNTGDAWHFVKVVGCLLLQVTVVLAVPFATMSVRDQAVQVPAVELIEEVLYWNDASEKGDIDFSGCLNADKIWDRDYLGWTCQEGGYKLKASFGLLVLEGSTAYDWKNNTVQQDSLKLSSISCMTCTLSVTFYGNAVVKLVEGGIMMSAGEERIGKLSVELSSVRFNDPSREKYATLIKVCNTMHK